MKNKPGKRFCGHCGAETVRSLVGAETVLVYLGMDVTCVFGTPYNRFTGKRQFCARYTCPQWENRFWGSSEHDDVTIEKIVYE